MNDEQFLNSDRGRIREIVSPTPRQRYQQALRERDFSERQVERLRRQATDPAVHTTADPADLLRRIAMARELLGPACERLAAAIERCTVLRPASQPRQQRKPQPVVWLQQPARAHTRDMASLNFKSGQDWLNYCRRGGRS